MSPLNGATAVALRLADGEARSLPRSNRRRALRIALYPSVAAVVVAVSVGAALGAASLGAVAGVVIGAMAAAALWRRSLAIVLRALRAQPLDEDSVPGVATLVEGLCATMGLAYPDLYVVDEPGANALALGRRDKDAALVLTSGLLASFDQVELEGVLAHELTHVKRDDVAPATVAAALVLVTHCGGAALVHRMSGCGREFDADRDAVMVTRYPPGLRQALAQMSRAPRAGALATGRPGRITRWLWTCELGVWLGDHPQVVGELDAPSVRISALDEW